MPYTTRDIAAQFMRQFVEESGALVYRRHGRGPAYRVTQQQAQDFLDQYMRHTRISRIVLFLATVALGGGGALLLAQAEPPPGDETIAAWGGGLVVLLVGLFVWAELHSQTSPARELAATAPVAPAIDRDEWTRTQLEAVPWVNFAILPFMGLFVVWAVRDEIGPLHGWGRAIWLVPLAFAVLASVQALRKWRTVRRH